MTVKELIKLLQKEDQSRLVVMSSDGEGNSIRLLSEVSIGAFQAEDGGYEGDLEDDTSDYGNKAVCLWPVG